MKKIIVGLAAMGIFGYVNAQTKDEIYKNLAQKIQHSQSNLQTSLVRASTWPVPSIDGGEAAALVAVDRMEQSQRGSQMQLTQMYMQYCQ
ncbi:hypothetical protein G6716_06650 [Polynucleobacter paneuropaeus]|nr:hypothetical protein G6716_06650 [Polynucleobacter paneuropaeus]